MLEQQLHENRRNIVGPQLPTLLDATCCVLLHTLLYVVGISCCAKFKLVKRTEQLPSKLHPLARGLMTTEIQSSNSHFLVFSDSSKIIRPFYSCVLRQQCPGLWINAELAATLFCYKPSCFLCANHAWYSRANKPVNMMIYIWKTRSFETKQGHRQPRFYLKPRALSTHL